MTKDKSSVKMNEPIHRSGSTVTFYAPLVVGTADWNDLPEETPPRTRTQNLSPTIESYMPTQLKGFASAVTSAWSSSNQRGCSSFTCAIFKVAISTMLIFLIPIAIYGNVPVTTFPAFLNFTKLCWDSLLHVNAYHVFAATLPFAFYFAHAAGAAPPSSLTRNHFSSVFDTSSDNSSPPPRRKHSDYDPTIDPTYSPVRKVSDYDCSIEAELCVTSSESIVASIASFLSPEKVCSVICTPRVVPVFITLFFCIGIVATSQLHIIAPSIAWMPFAWGTYKLYLPRDLSAALEGLCLNEDLQTANLQPLCLPESSWNTLSVGALSSKNADDVTTVMRGVEFAQKSGGIIINVMARDTVDAIEALRLNVEALARFFPKLSVVVFENDSVDGSREAFVDWSKNAQGYLVDIMQCKEAPDCKFGETHRYEEGFESTDYFKKSAVGSMVRFRQRMADYILAAPAYKDFTHSIVMDMDLGISLSPLGILHSLGKAPENAIASSGRTLWPGSMGSLAPPYDFSAFRPFVTDKNRRVVEIHRKWFCGLMPPGDKWRNQCDAVSSMHMMEVLAGDRSGDELYRVDSAFNGAVLYPLSDLRESGTKYDWGDDGQRCEHIGYNLGLRKTMYVNPKWDMHLNPAHPGGPSGSRAMKQVYRITVLPQLGIVMFIQNVGSMLIFVYSAMTLAMHVMYPLCVRSVVNVCSSRQKRLQRDQLPMRRFVS